MIDVIGIGGEIGLIANVTRVPMNLFGNPVPAP